MLELKHDKEADAVYILLDDKPYSYGKKVDKSRRVDYAQDGTAIGVEFLYVSDGVDVSDLPVEERAIGRLLEEHNLKVFA